MTTKDQVDYGTFEGERSKHRPWSSSRLKIVLILLVCSLIGLVQWTNEAKPTVQLIQSTPGEMMQEFPPIPMEPVVDWDKSYMEVDASQTFQSLLGFGGAFTEAAAIQFGKLSWKQKQEIIQLYFNNETGAGYTFGRLPINSCDFSPKSYNFDPVVADVNLQHFDMNVTHDQQWMIPFMQAAKKQQPDLKLFASPWSPPAWMKTPQEGGGVNGSMSLSMLGSAKPRGLNPDFQASWALYFSKFISAYKAHHLDIWGVTVQNEPGFAAPWESCFYTAGDQTRFIRDYLGPQLRKDHPRVKIMTYDFNRGGVFSWTKTALADPLAEKYIDGIAFHWYSEKRYMDGVMNHIELTKTHNLNNNKFLLATESSNCPGVASNEEAWLRGQRYAHDIIHDFHNWASGWVDWNLMLDQKGGPNHKGNFCDAPIIFEESKNDSKKDYFIQPMYFFIKHFSKYIQPGSRRIRTSIFVKFDKPGVPNLHPLYEATLWNCDESSRQHWIITSDSKIKLINTSFCLDTGLEYGHYIIKLVECRYTSNSWTFNADRIEYNGKCLSLSNGISSEGSKLTLDPCNNSNYQRWLFTGRSMLSRSSRTCVTAGYSFVQAVAFITPFNKTVLVAMNENSEDAHFTVKTKQNYGFKTVLPSGAIQTYIWD